MALVVVGFNHKTAPVAVRERLAFADQTLAEPLARGTTRRWVVYQLAAGNSTDPRIR
jgi:glutamyl-tRNA reductase